MLPSEVLQRRVVLVRTDLSEEHIASIFRVRSLKMGAIYSSERSVLTSSLVSHLQDEGVFLRNVCSYQHYTASIYPRRQYS
jgi:hypothetical protein